MLSIWHFLSYNQHLRNGQIKLIVIIITRHCKNKTEIRKSRTIEKVVKVLSIDDPIIDMIKPADYFRFMKNVGGGSGHRLIVSQFMVYTRGLRHRPESIFQVMIAKSQAYSN